MRFAKDFRRIAWDALENNYWMALLVSLIAAVLGGAFLTAGGFGTSLHYVGDPDVIALISASPYVLPILTILIIALSASGLFALAQFLVGGAAEIGLCRYNLGILDRKQERFSTLFTGFDIFAKALGLRCWTLLFVCLWSLLLVVPGLIAAFRYAMAPYIMAEDPSIGVREAVRISKKMMHGNKWRLFCLNLSFIGWYLLSLLTAGIGMVFLAPYINAAKAAFYLEVSGQNYRLASYNGAAAH